MSPSSHNQQSSMSPSQGRTLISFNDSFNEEGRTERHCLKTEREKGRRNKSHRCNRPDDIDETYQKYKRGLPSISADDDEKNRSDTSSKDASSTPEVGHNRRRTKICDGRNNLSVIRQVQDRLKTVVDYWTYPRPDTSPKLNKTLSKNVAMIIKRINA